jgi:Spy/CpxP family protein refolding chaperone
VVYLRYNTSIMKKLVACIPMILFLATQSMAQVSREVPPSQNTQSNEGKKHQRKEMMKALDLTKEQRAQMKDFHKSMKQQKENINSDNSLSQNQKQDKLKELHKSQMEKLNTILTPEQKEKLKEQRKKAKMQPDITNEALPPVKNPGK